MGNAKVLPVPGYKKMAQENILREVFEICWLKDKCLKCYFHELNKIKLIKLQL